MFGKLTSILSVILIIFTACSRENSTEPTNESLIDNNLVGIWYNSQFNEGIEISSDGKVRPTYVDGEGFIKSGSMGITIVITETVNGNWTGYDYVSSDETLKGEYSFSNDTLEFSTLYKNDTLLAVPLINQYKKSYEGERVEFNKFLSARINGESYYPSIIGATFNEGVLIFNASGDQPGALSVRVYANNTGVYELTGQSKGAFKITDGLTYATNSYNTGTVSIATLDTTNRFISGTFEFDAEATNGEGYTISITNGKFGVLY
ncbi:MAG: hypothetical protein K9J16_18155 [Melioribacteraceae bacterium]|nr:hypothetical protein [Melioribacteraceae bacterium]MCF8356798.1 hypothetical protein [Melioribacteraceae bacterium]MCF8396178.1 hypothetical protein [Melioribacteraceae bacterium]MCF8421125.1 hypothetical protein [Melioribacteraceae bacterium]